MGADEPTCPRGSIERGFLGGKPGLREVLHVIAYAQTNFSSATRVLCFEFRSRVCREGGANRGID